MVKNIEESLETHSDLIHLRLNQMITAANNLPGTMNAELTKKLREIIKEILQSMKDRDEIHFQIATKQREAVLEMQKSQEAQNTLMLENIINLKASVKEFQKAYVNQEQQTDTVLTAL